MVIVIMGVSGSGKTTVGTLLAARLGWRYFEGDEYHSAASVEKMRRGVALDDSDRWPWLEALRGLIVGCLARGESAVLACSALKESYREFLSVDERVVFVYLEGDYEVIARRLGARRGHYMNPGLLESQFDALEEPADAVRLDISASPDELVAEIRSRLGL